MLLIIISTEITMNSFFQGNLNQDNVIEANKQMCEQSNEEYGLDDPEKLDEIIFNIQSVDRIENKRERIIRKVSLLLVGLGYNQPFKNGNKRTALSISILMLRLTQFDIPFYTKEQKKEVFDLLENLMFKFEDDIPDLIPEVEHFLRDRIVKI